ncbi:HNH endonuclease signature motif containing protein [Streptomyces albidoflavus]
MAQDRPDIPTALKRTILVEAGHRCAIPTCRQTPVELAHITPWSKIKEHTFDNLIALCPTYHTRFDRDDIDRKSMLQYKQNLEVLNGRYTDVERQVLKVYARILG